jgi:hypothetical protein
VPPAAAAGLSTPGIVDAGIVLLDDAGGGLFLPGIAAAATAMPKNGLWVLGGSFVSALPHSADYSSDSAAAFPNSHSLIHTRNKLSKSRK